MIDLSDQFARMKLVSQIETDIDAYCRETMQDGHRTHLGASEIGDPCTAKAWNSFRWLKQEKFSGRMLRLFERGHLEESRFIKLLRGIGFTIREVDEKGEQVRIVGVNGHFGGSLDAMAKFPISYGVSAEIIILNEYKTHNEKSFTKLAGAKDASTGKRIFVAGTNGVRINKPVHYAQMCSYGRAFGFHYALYCAVNKDTDELYFEIVPLLPNYLYADDLYRKADNVINSQTQPPKIAQVKTYFECKYCHFSPICFDGEKPEKNCRSCKFAAPIANAEWTCKGDTGWGKHCGIPKEIIATGCDKWTAIINAV